MRLSNARLDEESLANTLPVPVAPKAITLRPGPAVRLSYPARVVVLVIAAGFIFLWTNRAMTPGLLSPTQQQSAASPARAPAMHNTLDASTSANDSVLLLPPLEPEAWRRALDHLQSSSLANVSVQPQPRLETPQLNEPALDGAPAVPVARIAPNIKVAQASLDPVIDKPNPSLLVTYGNEYLARADVAAARLLYRRAADDGSASGAAALAACYDPVYLKQRALHGVRPDPKEALRWYHVATEMGDPSAASRVAALMDWLRSAALGGDNNARALLEQASR